MLGRERNIFMCNVIIVYIQLKNKNKNTNDKIQVISNNEI